MIDILVFSHAGLRRANRLIYNKLKDEYGFDIVLVIPKSFQLGDNISIAEEKLNDDVNTIEEKLVGKNPRSYFFKNTFKNIRRYKPEIIYVDNDPISVQVLLIGLWSKLYGIKLVCLTCENIEISLKQKLKTKSLKKVLLALMKLSLAKLTKHLVKHVFTINNSGTTIYASLGYKSVSKIPLGFDSSIFNINAKDRIAIRSKLKIDDDTPIISYIGRITFEKGIHVLLKSLSMIKTYDWVFMLDEFKSTKTSYHTQIKKLIKDFGLENKVIYIDAKHLEISKYMNAADLVIIPSISTEEWIEQYGRVAPEAMACGKLLIASDTGALPDLIGDSGILVKENDELQLKDAILSVLDNPTKYKNKQMLATKRAKQLDLNQQANKMSRVFRNVI